MRASSAQSPSSLLSQSFFKKKMQDSVDTVIEKLEKQMEEHQTKSGSPNCYQPISAGDVGSCGNSFTAESEFSYSQAEDDSVNHHSDQESVEEDEAIVNILLEMQQEGKPDQVDSDWNKKRELDRYNKIDDYDNREQDISKWDDHNGEIGDILASQRFVEKLTASQEGGSPHGNGWWDIAESISRPTASPLSELGSPRVILHTPQKRTQKPTTNTVRAIRFEASPEDLPLVGDIEDLLPPRPQEPIPLTPTEEESDPVDRLQLSLTPHPHPLGASPRVQAAPATGNNRLWLFGPEPPTFSQILSSSHNAGVNPIQYQSAFYSNSADIPDKAMVFGGKKFNFTPQNTSNLPVFDTTSTRQLLNQLDSGGSCGNMTNPPWCKLSQLKSLNIPGGQRDK
ncbi:DNA polymerase zeta catalytic subunit, partial [Phytophthora palmivora]